MYPIRHHHEYEYNNMYFVWKSNLLSDGLGKYASKRVLVKYLQSVCERWRKSSNILVNLLIKIKSSHNL